MTIFDLIAQEARRVNALAYNKPVKPNPIDSGQLFRLERAQPFYRTGVLVKAVPQFRALNLFSPTAKNTILPTITVTPTQVTYPVKVK